MVIASLNGTHAQGFIEVIERGDGTVERTGMLKFSVPSAMRLRRFLDEKQPLTYEGPVLANGRWRAETCSIVATRVETESGAQGIVTVTVCDWSPSETQPTDLP